MIDVLCEWEALRPGMSFFRSTAWEYMSVLVCESHYWTLLGAANKADETVPTGS